jgi:hypothetical protein
MTAVARKQGAKRLPGARDTAAEEFQIKGANGDMPALVMKVYSDINDLAIGQGNVVCSLHS